MHGENAVASLILRHLERYPLSGIEDVYKLLHHGAFGPGHAITNRKVAREWLERDWNGLSEESGMVLVESVHPSGEVVRLHLRPYRDAGGDLRKLLDAFIASAGEYPGNPELMISWWAIFEELTRGPLADRFDARLAALIGRTRAREGWPATHHSPTYEKAYKPAYRVLSRTRAEELLASQGIPWELK